MIIMNTFPFNFNTVFIRYYNIRMGTCQWRGRLIGYGRLLNIYRFTWALIREGRLKEAGHLFESVRYKVTIKNHAQTFSICSNERTII